MNNNASMPNYHHKVSKSFDFRNQKCHSNKTAIIHIPKLKLEKALKINQERINKKFPKEKGL